MVSTVCCLQLKLLAIACWKQRESTSCNVDVECAATLKVNFPTSSKFQLTLPPTTILFRQSSSQTLMSDLQWSETKGNLNSKYDDAWKKSRSLSLSKDHSEHSQPRPQYLYQDSKLLKVSRSRNKICCNMCPRHCF